MGSKCWKQRIEEKTVIKNKPVNNRAIIQYTYLWVYYNYIQGVPEKISTIFEKYQNRTRFNTSPVGDMSERTTRLQVHKMSQSVKIIEFHYYIWNHHKKCIQISTDMPGIGLEMCGILIILRGKKRFCMDGEINGRRESINIQTT